MTTLKVTIKRPVFKVVLTSVALIYPVLKKVKKTFDGSDNTVTVPLNGYRSGQVMAFLNGILQESEGLDYTETNQNLITFTATAGDLNGSKVEVMYVPR